MEGEKKTADLGEKGERESGEEEKSKIKARTERSGGANGKEKMLRTFGLDEVALDVPPEWLIQKKNTLRN